MGSQGKFWPSMCDYQEAVQTPSFCFSDSELSKGDPVMNNLGLPRPICGTFASVYEFTSKDGRWAIKCFLRNIPDQHDRYAKISAHLSTCTMPYFMTFEYQPKGIRVAGNWYPIVKMDWIEGCALNQFIERNVSNTNAMQDLEQRWLVLLEDLKSVMVGHGDLQHGNVLVSDDGSLRLIDYDGMWVPKLKGQQSHETGHPDYQSPLRTAKDFDANIDGFAGDLIHIAIRALIKQPELWQKYDNGDNLLFRRQDYTDTGGSALIGELQELGDEEIEAKLPGIIKACGGKSKGWGRRAKPKPAPAPAPAPQPVAKTSVKSIKPKLRPHSPAPAPKPVLRKPLKPKPQPKPKPAFKQAVTTAPPPPSPADLQATLWSPTAVRTRAKATARSQPAAPQGTGTWLDDHVTVAVAAPPAKRSPRAVRAARASRSGSSRGLLGYLRIIIHVLVIVPVAAVAITQLVTMLSGVGGKTATVLLSEFGAATVLGLISLLSFFVLRGIHRTASILFFLLTAITMVLTVVWEYVFADPSALTTQDLIGWILLGLSVLGLLIELACRRV